MAYSNELYHHGIKGQKWGVRRFRNRDGSLTPEGVKRYVNPNKNKIFDSKQKASIEDSILNKHRNKLLSIAKKNEEIEKSFESLDFDNDEQRNKAQATLDKFYDESWKTLDSLGAIQTGLSGSDEGLEGYAYFEYNNNPKNGLFKITVNRHDVCTVTRFSVDEDGWWEEDESEDGWRRIEPGMKHGVALIGEYYAVTYSRSLSHHGIKGQQWGKRRFQYEDGSLTPEGKKRYGIGDRIRSTKTNLHNKMRDTYSKQYQQQYKGMSKEEADAAAEKRIKTMKKVAIGAGIVVGTAAAVYVARNAGRNWFDETIKAGTTVQTLADDPNRLENGKAFYTAFRDADKMKYAGLFGASQNGGFKNKIQAVAEKDIKVASTKTAKKVYEDLKKNDPEFRQLIKVQEKNLGLQKALDFGGNKSEYDKFNTYDLLSPDENSMKVQKKFYDKLKDMGYQGVHDVNDRKYSGFNTKATIIFDNDNFKKNAAGSLEVKVSKLSQEEVQKGSNFAAAAMFGDTVTHPKVVATGAAVVGMMAIDKTDREVAQEQAQKKKQNKVAK